MAHKLKFLLVEKNVVFGIRHDGDEDWTVYKRIQRSDQTIEWYIGDETNWYKLPPNQGLENFFNSGFNIDKLPAKPYVEFDKVFNQH